MVNISYLFPDSSSIPTEPDESSEDKNDIDELSNGNSSEEHSVVLSMSPPFATENGKLTSSSNPGEKKKDTDKKKGSRMNSHELVKTIAL